MNRLRIIFFFAALLLCRNAGAQYMGGAGSLEGLYDSETVRSMKEHVAYLSGAQLEGRKAGSEGERLSAAYLRDYLASVGVDIIVPPSGSEFAVVREGADTLRSLNVCGFIQGWDPNLNGHYIVIGARMDNLGSDTYTVNGETTLRIYYGANGNASGMAMLLELAKKLSMNRSLLRRSVLIMGFGASRETLAGSWYFLNRAFSDVDRIDAMINLDMVGTGGNGFYAYTSGNADLNQIVRQMRGELLPVTAELTTVEPYTGDHRAFYDREIPSVLFTTGRYSQHDTGRDSFDIVEFDEMERELEYVYSFTQTLCNGRKPLFRITANTPAREPSVVAWSDVDTKPVFMNSADPSAFMRHWVYEYLRYPEYAVQNGIQGSVLVDFIVDETGRVTDVHVSRSVHEALDAEAVRVIEASPKWRPGRHRGKKVKVAMTVAVEFRLQRRSDGSFGINGMIIN